MKRLAQALALKKQTATQKWKLSLHAYACAKRPPGQYLFQFL